ncbi:MAG: 3-deoxy-7-phosphoheptulonate synthase [Gammaproteobacteria bacterium]|jgi:3-deoxy-7-phosphoheptulonate synthase|nr:3-deoxy-7-phosphoheptulonate synthase [Gammaproteobacteria bacterium]
MIVILKPGIDISSAEYQFTLKALMGLAGIEIQLHTTKGFQETVVEIYLIGDTSHISKDNLEALPGVLRVLRISSEYKILGRNQELNNGFEFEYNGVTFSQNNLNIFAGLCAVDELENAELMMKALHQHGQVCTRMGAYKPRTSPYSFQGLGKACLPYVFEMAGKYGIKVIAMEVTHERHIEEISEVLQQMGNPTGVMLQIGTRNAQNFELLRAVGSQQTFPVLFKRGYGITLSESIHAAEYLAHAGNHRVIFCLRGVKSLFGSPHRNMVDFAHVPVIRRLTRMPVCIDPSHSVGIAIRAPDGLNDIFHATAQGIISGANMVLVDFHPTPPTAVVDSRQAIALSDLNWYLEDIAIARAAYDKRTQLAKQQGLA